jgi:hypothetical protein
MKTLVAIAACLMVSSAVAQSSGVMCGSPEAIAAVHRNMDQDTAGNNQIMFMYGMGSTISTSNFRTLTDQFPMNGATCEMTATLHGANGTTMSTQQRYTVQWTDDRSTMVATVCNRRTIC